MSYELQEILRSKGISIFNSGARTAAYILPALIATVGRPGYGDECVCNAFVVALT